LSNDKEVPAATVVQDGKLGGDTPKTAAAAPRQPYKRKLSNFMLDKKLQLRYVMLVTVLSAMISGSLGYLIYHQRHQASASIDSDLAALTQSDASFSDVKNEVAEDNAHDDRMLVYKMAGVGIGLVLILSAYLVIMTHKVAGPLFKVSLYLAKMRDGRFDKVYNLRKGDQLVDFYDQFKAAHGGIVAMQRDDIARIAQVIAAADAAGLGQHPAIAELRELSARKEKSIE